MDLSWSKSRPVSTSSVTSSPGWNFVQWSAIPPLWISAFSRAVQSACATRCCECRLSDPSPTTPPKTGSSSTSTPIQLKSPHTYKQSPQHPQTPYPPPPEHPPPHHP